ncbi:hypothetical protein ACMT1E_00845 [Sphingomonas flavalba]|uniref:hypothetical protein n=1 Tax=Sphingomonas flavalba TaxID=2559804 RepID=UPI0039DFF8E7
MTGDNRDRDAQARTRYFALSLVRLSGAVLVLIGIVVTSGRVESLPAVAGYALIGAGLLDMVLFPRLLARRWRTPPRP